MPKFRVPWKFSAHRVAAKALYRALLSQCSKAGLRPEQQLELSNVVRNRFKENYYNHSKVQIPVLFRAGYSAIDHLDAAAAGDEASRHTLIKLLDQTPHKAKRPPRQVIRVTKKPSTSTILTSEPDALLTKRSIWDRPLPLSELTGKRRVPRMVNASGMPMLRIKKPQPPALSAYIRARNMRKERRLKGIMRIEELIEVGAREDDWDDMIEDKLDIDLQHPQDLEATSSWQTVLLKARADIRKTLDLESTKYAENAQKMQDIVDKEKALLIQERHDRHQKRRAVRGDEVSTEQ